MTLIAFAGLPGSGKSTLAELLSSELGAPVIVDAVGPARYESWQGSAGEAPRLRVDVTRPSTAVIPEILEFLLP